MLLWMLISYILCRQYDDSSAGGQHTHDFCKLPMLDVGILKELWHMTVACLCLPCSEEKPGPSYAAYCMRLTCYDL